MFVVAKNLFKPSHLWMQRSALLFEHDIQTLLTDATSSKTAAKDTAFFRFKTIPLWQVPPKITARIRGRLNGTSERIWREEPARRLLRELNRSPNTPLLIHFFDQAIELQSAIYKASNPVFVFIHGADIDWASHLDEQSTYKEQCLSICKRAFLVANSSYTCSKLIADGFDPQRVFTHHFGITPPLIDRSYTNKTPLEILFLGRLLDMKGPDLVIRAFHLAVNQGLNAVLRIAGDGYLRSRCESLSVELGISHLVKFLGEVSKEEGHLLRMNADIFTAHNMLGTDSQREESFGVSILEAMAYGLPVITGRSGGVIDMIIDNHNGMLVEPGDVKQHSIKLLQLGRSLELRKRLGEHAYQTVIKNFSSEREVASLHEIIKTAMKKTYPINRAINVQCSNR